MNHNPNNVKVKTIAVLDDKVLVFVEKMTKGQMFSKVSCDGDTWSVMTQRLKPYDDSNEIIWVGAKFEESVKKLHDDINKAMFGI